MLSRSRVDSLVMLEKILFGKSSMDGAPDEKKESLTWAITKLDRDFFPFRPANELSSKYKEEQGEFLDALTSYVQNHKNIKNPKYLESMKYLIVAELSDVILSASTYLTFIASPDVDRVVKDMKELLEKSIRICEPLGSVFFETLDISSVLDHHINKMSEICRAVTIYEEVLYFMDRSEETSKEEVAKWVSLILQLHSFNEIRDPRNKYKIIKEIRRMQFAMINMPPLSQL